MRFSKGSSFGVRARSSRTSSATTSTGGRSTRPTTSSPTLLSAEFEDEHGVTRTLTRDEALLYVNIVAGAGQRDDQPPHRVGRARCSATTPTSAASSSRIRRSCDNAIEELLRYRDAGPDHRPLRRPGRRAPRPDRAGGQRPAPARTTPPTATSGASTIPTGSTSTGTIGQHLDLRARHPLLPRRVAGAARGPRRPRRGAEAVPRLGGRHRERANGVRRRSSGAGRRFRCSRLQGADVTGYLGLDTDQEQPHLRRVRRRHRRRYGDREALIFGDRRITFRQLEDEVRPFARALLAAGVTKGSSVALMLANRPEFVIAAYGAGSIGAVVVPVSTFAPSDERDYILRHSDACVLVTQASLFNHRFVDELLDSHPELAEGVPGQLRSVAFPFLRRIVSLDPAHPGHRRALGRRDRTRRRDARGPPRRRDGRRCTRATPASSSTPPARAPTPKACCTRTAPRSSRAGAGAGRMGLTPDDKLLSKFPYFWSAGLTMTLGGPLSAGATVITIESFDAGTALEIMEREQVTARAVHAGDLQRDRRAPRLPHARPVGADPRRRRRAAVRRVPRPGVASQ